MYISPLDRQAIAGLILVAGKDKDRARLLNGIGFSQNDSFFCHSLIAQFNKFGRLSPKQWVYVRKMAYKYRDQIERLEKKQLEFKF